MGLPLMWASTGKKLLLILRPPFWTARLKGKGTAMNFPLIRNSHPEAGQKPVPQWEKDYLERTGSRRGFGLFRFTHWIVIPENEKHYAFAKAISLAGTPAEQERRASEMRERKIEVYPYSKNPPISATSPVYKATDSSAQ